jgi:PleD family two-component response regulator
LAHASIDTAPATALRVVVVDDSQTLRTRVRLALERAGLRWSARLPTAPRP